MEKIFARKYEPKDKVKNKVSFQTLKEHLNNVAQLSADHAEIFGSTEWGRLIGLLHDIGKARKEFQIKLTEKPNLHVDHSGAGAALLAEQQDVTSYLAFTIAGHHAGLPDSTHLEKRVEKNKPALLQIGALNQIPKLVLELPEWLRGENFKDANSQKRSFEFWIRFLFSALVDADRLDAELFDLRMKALEQGIEVNTGRKVDIPISVLQDRLDAHINKKMSLLSNEKKGNRVNVVRAEVLKSCRNAAVSKPGFFSLAVPTGGGKTLSGMSFALNHARENKMRRVICVIPYTSIIEQNAAVYREALGDENVLEHHCNYNPEKEKNGEANDETLTLFEKATENWDFPVIVTTTVQFFESLFANGTKSCRKLHNIARSVIILDEAQSLPPEFIGTLLDGMKELVEHYGCSIVISTATQPAWETSTNFQGIDDIRPIITEPQKLFGTLKRICYHWPQKDERLSDWGELADEALKHKNVLLITHKRKDARELTKEIQLKDSTSLLFHLSAQMCPAHRFHTLEKINLALKNSVVPCRVVSTQLVEAGVDLDFDVVYRALGGLDSIVQAAGRCNREGRNEQGHVYIYRLTDPPSGAPLHGRDTCETMLNAAELEGIELDLEKPDIFKEYFLKFYLKRKIDPIPKERERFHYETVDRLLKIIDEEGRKSVVVPYGDAANVIKSVQKDGWSKTLRRMLQQYTVQISEQDFVKIFYSLKELTEGSGVYVLEHLYRESYDSMFGLLPPEEMKISAEDCII